MFCVTQSPADVAGTSRCCSKLGQNPPPPLAGGFGSTYPNETLLGIAASAGNLGIMFSLVEAGADPRADDSQALVHAAHRGNDSCLSYLLKCGADPNAQGGDALRGAAVHGHTEC